MNRHSPPPEGEYSNYQYYNPGQHYNPYSPQPAGQHTPDAKPEKKRSHRLMNVCAAGALVVSASVFAHDNYPDKVLSARYAVAEFVDTDQPCASEGLSGLRDAAAIIISDFDPCEQPVSTKPVNENS
jgi:hypothetical protein